MLKNNKKSIKEYWKEKSFAWKGGIIGILFGTFIFIGAIMEESLGVLTKIFAFFMFPAIYLMVPIITKCHSVSCFALILIVYILPIIIYGLLGLLIGFIIDLIRRKKK